VVPIKNLTVATGILTFALACFSPVAGIQQGQTAEKTNADAMVKKYSAGVEAVRAFFVATLMARQGYHTQDPLLLLSSASMLKRMPTRPMDEEPSMTVEAGAAGEAKEQEPEEKKGRSLKVEELIQAARDLSGEDQLLKSLADRIAQQSSRGAVVGPEAGSYRADALTTTTFTVTFKPGEQATVVVMGDGDTDLDLIVYDENNNLITQDTDSGDQCLVTWTPRWQGNFKIVVKNLGFVYNQYAIAHN
jgi:hypothetical protein